MNEPGNTFPRRRMFEEWLAGKFMPGSRPFVYHRGELARDRKTVPGLAALADRMLELSEGKYDVVSRCGHVRGRIVGTGQLRVTTDRERGETVYMAVRLSR